MRYLFCLLLVGCSANSIDPEKVRMDSLVSSFKENQKKSSDVQSIATDDSKKTIGKTVTTIVSLKTEVAQLKTELNEVKAKLDVATSVDTGSKFKLRPISRN